MLPVTLTLNSLNIPIPLLHFPYLSEASHERGFLSKLMPDCFSLSLSLPSFPCLPVEPRGLALHVPRAPSHTMTCKPPWAQTVACILAVLSLDCVTHRTVCSVVRWLCYTYLM
ncbi:hypothetical protein FKM82_005585 [Ascaphus truei]